MFITSFYAPFHAHGNATKKVAKNETPQSWIALGKRIHGGFGSFIALGIRLGLDADKRLKAAPRELDVSYFSSTSAPCPCVADGLMISTRATPGQGSLRVLDLPNAPQTLGIALIKNKRTGQTLRYVIPRSALTILDAANKKSERARYDAIMNSAQNKLFRVQIVAVVAKKNTK